jgi:Tfp pilus assembly protein PilF
MLFVCAVILTVSGCSRAVKPASPDDTPKAHYLAGMKLLDDKDPLKPEAEFARAVILDKRSPCGYAGMAALYLKRENLSRALKFANRALARDPSFADAAFLKGRIYLAGKRGDRFEKAEALFRRLLELEPGSERALFFLGETFLGSYRFEEAKNFFAQAAGKKGENAVLAAARGELATRIIEAKPATEDGKRISLVEKASRADLCHLLIGELKLKDLVKRYRLLRYEAIYHGDKGVREIPPDIEEREDLRILLDVMALRLPHLNVYPNGDFYPERWITRAECAMIIQEIMELLSDDPTLATRYADSGSPFPDVRPDYYAFNAIMLGVEREIVSSDPSTGRFDPDGAVRGVDALFMIRALESLYPETSSGS